MFKKLVVICTLIFTSNLFASGLTPAHFQRNFEGQAHINDQITYCLVKGRLPQDSEIFSFTAVLGQDDLVEIKVSKAQIKEQLTLHADYVTLSNRDTSIQLNFDGFDFTSFFYQKKNAENKITTQFTCGKD